MRHICTKAITALPAAALLLAVLAFASAAQAAGREAGNVVSVTPGAFVERGGQRLPLEVKAPIYSGDMLITDAKGRLRAWMRDETTLSLGPDTEFDIEEYDDAASKPVFKAKMTGLARMLTGEISKANPAGFKLTTPQATVGIRGTILTVRSGDGRTTVFVENTMRQVVVNGVTVPTGSKAEVPAAGAAPRISPMTPADRQALGNELAARSGAQPAAGGVSSGTMVAAAAPADAPAAPAGLVVDNMLADSSSSLSQAIALSREATVTGNLTPDQTGWTGTYTLNGVNLASGAFRSGAMKVFDQQKNTAFDLTGDGGILNGGSNYYVLTGSFYGDSSGATGRMNGTVQRGSFSARSNPTQAATTVSGSYQSTSVRQ